MSVLEMKIIESLDEDDQSKIAYFVNLLLRQGKYRHLRDELKKRRLEIKNGAVLNHDELWNQVDV